MKLQIALDELSLGDALSLMKDVHEWVDIIEIGTPFLLRSGLAAVTAFRERWPEKEVLADVKIMDAGAYEATLALRAGANYVTVLGVTDDITIRRCLEAADALGGEVVVDMLCVADLSARIRSLEAMGVRALAVHTGTDQQAAGRTPLDDLKQMRACARSAKISVAGGITPETLPDYAACAPEVVIAGGGICRADDPVAAAREMYALIQRFNRGA